MLFDLRVGPPEKRHMVYPCVMTRNHPKHTWRWYFNVTISRGFRLNHLNGSSDSIGRWENTNTRSQKDLVNVCFTSIKCVWKPEPKISKTNKHKGNFHTISVWLVSWYIWNSFILLLLIHSDYTSMFTLCHLVLRGTFQSQKTHVRISSKIIFLWWVKLLTLYELGKLAYTITSIF